MLKVVRGEKVGDEYDEENLWLLVDERGLCRRAVYSHGTYWVPAAGRHFWEIVEPDHQTAFFLAVLDGIERQVQTVDIGARWARGFKTLHGYVVRLATREGSLAFPPHEIVKPLSSGVVA